MPWIFLILNNNSERDAEGDQKAENAWQISFGSGHLKGSSVLHNIWEQDESARAEMTVEESTRCYPKHHWKINFWGLEHRQEKIYRKKMYIAKQPAPNEHHFQVPSLDPSPKGKSSQPLKPTHDRCPITTGKEMGRGSFPVLMTLRD